jgi:hypothetical protein
MIPVVYENHPADSRIEEMGNVCSTVTSRWGTGGGNVPLATAYSIREDAQANNFSATELEVANTLKALQPSAQSHHAQTFVAQVDCYPISTQNALGRVNGRDDWPLGLFAEGEPSPTLTKAHGHAVALAYNFAPGKGDLKDDIYVTKAETTKTLDASGSNPAMHQGGVGVVQPKVFSFDSTESNSMKSSNPDSGCREVDLSKTLDTTQPNPAKGQGGIGIMQPISFDLAQITSKVNGTRVDSNLPVSTLAKGSHMHVAYPIAFSVIDDGQDGTAIVQPVGTDLFNGTITGDISMTLKRGDGNPAINQPTVMQAMAVRRLTPMGVAFDTYNQTLSDVNQTIKSPVGGANESIGTVIAPALTTNNPSRSPQASEVTQQVNAVYQASMAVRRLTPIECERLQGFPDNYTNIKTNCPDGPRYKALGNSMAVPVMQWIGQRISDYENNVIGKK